jgi:hypothetical protein
MTKSFKKEPDCRDGVGFDLNKWFPDIDSYGDNSELFV